MNPHDPSQSDASTQRLSRTAAGRVSGVVARLLAGATSVQATGRFLRRQVWVWPILAAVLFGGAGWWVHQSVEDAMHEQRATELNVMVDANVSALRVWMGEQEINANLFAEDEQLRPLVEELLDLADSTLMAERSLLQSMAQDLLRERLNPRIKIGSYAGYFVVAPDGVVLAAEQDAPVGKSQDGYRRQIFVQACEGEGETVVSRPFRSALLLTDEKGQLRANLPTMFAIAPLRDEAGRPIAALGLRIRPEDQFTRILEVVRFGEGAETYAFDSAGLLLSQSRFDDQLKQLGLLVDEPDAKSILTVEVRDPQVNMVLGERPTIRRADQPLTHLATNAVQGKDGYNAEGYRGYRGVLKVGAWRWLKDYEIGVGTEVNADEAFRPVHMLRIAFRLLMGLLLASAVGIFLAMRFIARQQVALQNVTLAARQLGQYTLEEKLGAGGMGTVYKARHAMLRRPTAVKLLDIDKMSDAAVARFEREVQLTSALTHPNTVAVFDYGHTSDGVFYYAMEYLDGLNLEDLVSRFGPLSEARMLYLLKQVCGSLGEAHARGLVHRDIKPANIFLTCRGGMHDFVKVLDFGLVKSLEGDDKSNITSPNAVTGTPLYISPEALNQSQQVDARADVYAVAGVAYYLLTGTPVFSGGSVMEICLKQLKHIPEPPSIRYGKPVAADLEALLLRCLAKAPSDRPRDAAELLHELEQCDVTGEWTATDAGLWWADHAEVKDQPSTLATTRTSPIEETRTRDVTVDL